MKKVVSLIICFGLTNLTFSQQQISGSNFEAWNQNHYNTSFPTLYYWEVMPTSVWASSNAATTIVNNFCMQQTADAHSGSFAAYLETKNIFGQVASGNLFTGYFIADLFNSKAMRGIPFTSRPSIFRGFYKYTSVSYSYNSTTIPDSCAIYAILSKWNGSQRVEVGKAEMFSSTNINTYTEFVLPFNYNSSTIPDTISVVFASSKNGEFFRGGIGSKLYVDDISFSYVSEVEENISIETESYISQNQWLFQLNKELSGEIDVFDISGRKIYHEGINGNEIKINVDGWKNGAYCYIIIGSNEIITGKIIR